MQLSVFTVILSMLISSAATGQTLGQYQFNSALGVTCLTRNVSVSAQPANAAFSTYTNMGGDCIASTTAFINSDVNDNKNLDVNKYNTFTITPAAGYFLTLNSITFTQSVNENGTSGSTGSSWVLRSSEDGYVSNLGTGPVTTTTQTSTVNLSPLDFKNTGAITFRLYLLNAKRNTTTWTNENVILTGASNPTPANPGNPTSNSPQCLSSGVTLTRAGTPPAGVTWYWQTVATDTVKTNSGATFNVSASGTYYIRARNNTTSLWSAGAGSVAVVITPNVGPVTFTSGSSTRCQGAGVVDYTATATNTTGITYTLNTAAAGTINAATGDVTYLPGWSGTSIVTATASGCGTATSATFSVVTTPSVATPVFSAGPLTTLCQGAQTITYTATATNNTGLTYSLDAASLTGNNTIVASSGAVTYAATWSGTTTITVTAAGCSPKTANFVVTVNSTIGTPIFGAGATSARCQATSAIKYSATSVGTSAITYSLDAFSLANGNSIAADGTVTFGAGFSGTSTVTATATGCGGPKSATHVITTSGSVAVPVFTLGASSSRCQGAGTVSYAGTAAFNTGLTYSLDLVSSLAGNSINTANGTVTYSPLWTGTSTISISAAGCSGPKTASHTATTNAPVTTPAFTGGATSTRCQGAGTVSYGATAFNTTSITYSIDAASISGGNSIDASNGNVTYSATWKANTIVTVTAIGCTGTKTATHTATTTASVGTPVFIAGTNSERCQSAGSITYAANASTNTGLSYSLDALSIAGGNSININSGAVTYAAGWYGASVITATATGCNGPTTASHNVITNRPVTVPVFASGATSVICQNPGTVTYAASANFTTGITYSIDASSMAGGNSINPSNGAVTYAAGWKGTTVVTASAAGCFGPLTSIHTVTIKATVGKPVFDLGSASVRCVGAETITYSASATTSNSISYSLDATSLSGGNVISASTGAVTYANTWVGTSIVTATAQGCNGPTTATHTIVTSGPVTVPVFAAGSSSIQCHGAYVIGYNASSDYATTITYSLDGTSLASGNTINATTGVVTYAAGWYGTTNITATASGCYGPKSSVHTVTITATVGVPVFTMGSASVRCQGPAKVTYAAAATTTTGITYSLDGASLSGGNTINASTGEVSYVTGWSGTTIITARAVGCNGPYNSTHTVTVTPTVGTPVFLLGSTSVHCQDLTATAYSYTAASTNNTSITYTLDGASLTGGNSIDPASGVVTFVSTWTGTSIITATAAGCNGPSMSSHTVTVTPSAVIPVFSLGGSTVRCQGAGSVLYAASSPVTTGITYSLDPNSSNAGNTISSTTGLVTYSANWSGTSTVTASAAGCNGPKTINHVITITPTVGVPVFNLGATSSRCHGSNSITYSATASTNTGVTYSLDATSLAAGNSIVSTSGVVTFVNSWEGISVITVTAEGCNGPSTASHTVTTNGSVTVPVFSAGSASVRCQGAGSVSYAAASSNTTGINYTLDVSSLNAGNIINANTGLVTYAATWFGTSVITGSAAGCYGPQVAIHVVTITRTVSTPIFSSGAASTRCQGPAVITYSASALTTTGITYSLNAQSIAGGNSINPDTGEVTYTTTYSGTTMITASAAGCNGPATSTHSVTVTPTVGIPVFNSGTSSVRCQGTGTITYTATATNNTGINYALDATSLAGGNVIDATNGAITYTSSWSGTSVITSTAAGCNGPATSTHIITTTPTAGLPVFDLSSSSVRCQGAGTVAYTASSTNNTGITYSLDAASKSWGNTINSTTGAVTYLASWNGISTITATATGCNGPKSSIHTVTITATVGIPVFVKGATSNRCHAAGSVSYSANATTTTGITYSLDAASLAAGNIIDASTGDVTYVDAWEGTSFITASATGCNGPRTSTHTVTTNGTVTIPLFAEGSASIRCQGAANVTYSANSNYTTGITYSLDAASKSFGNTINLTSGVVSYLSGWSGTSVVTANAAGCYGPQVNTHTITITPTVSIPVFASGATSSRCQGAGTIIYDATATTTTGITYSLNAASISGGNTINAISGAVTYAAGYSGTTIVTASAAGCNGPQISTHSVIVTPTVGATTFLLGSASSRCQGSGTLTYTATASMNTGITYTLDDNSLIQGNSINAATGAVTFSPGWGGTSVITATSTGCNGPTSATHTVSITPTVGEPVFVLGTNSARCKIAETITYAATATNTTGITYSLDSKSIQGGNTINPATGAVTYKSNWKGTTTITASAAGCNGPDFSTHVVVIDDPVTTPVFASGASSTRCQGAGTATYTANSNNESSMTYSLNTASLSAGNSINASTGVVTYTANWAGTSVITATAAGCFGPLSANHTVTITPTTATPVFTSGSTSTRCTGAGTVSYPATAPSTIAYSLDAASIVGGNTINSSTGAVNFVTGWVGTTVITARAAGCGTPAATHTVSVTPTVGNPVFSLGASSSRCQGSSSITYSSSSTNATGITYSLDAASLAGGNTINASTGAVTYVAGWNNTTTITASATGCNGPATSIHTVSVNGNGTPSFTLGSSSSRIQAAGNITYTAVSNNGGAVTYSLDAVSLGAGNTINSSTGTVTYSVSWSGTTIITASSTGCIGTVSATHTVTVSPSSVIKQLYLSDPSQSLDRIDPVATNDLSTTNSAVLASGGTTTFTQSPVLCSPLTIKIGRNIVVTNYVTISSGTMPSNPAITAVLKYGTTNIITLTNPVYTSSTGLLTWTGTLGADLTVPANQSIALTITTAQAGVAFTINYDSKTKPSKIDLPVSTFINISALNVYNAPYPGGSVITGAVTGTRNYIRATVTDPFGFNDITGLDVTITPTGSTVAAVSVATSACSRIYEYVWNSPPTAGYFDISARAKEGFENTVSVTKNILFSNCTDCPPIAFDDSAIGAGGAPITIDVLANDLDPNDNLNPAALTIVTDPQNGNVFVSNGQVVYLPNGTFTGTDQFTYQICDLTSPTPLCATATVKVDIDPTIVDPCSETAQSHIYYLPYPEQDARIALIASTNASYLPIPSNNIRTIISVKVPYPGMIIRWDHWEDGYEANILNPVQATTKIWGDGNPYNGIAPGYPSDIIPAGGSFVFDNTMPANPRNAANIFYDGKDKVQSSGEISITQVLGEPSIIGLQSMKTNVTATADFGKSFTIPVGQNFNSQDFRYTALFIRASENNTLVSIDKDNNGTFEITTTLNEGQSLLVNGGVMTGATITGSAPIGVDLHFGGVDGYSSREVPVYPATWYSNVYYTPVPTTKTANPSVVMFYNNLNRAITINWTSGAPASGTIPIAAKTAVRFQLANSTTNTYKFVNPTGESFTAIEIVDSYTPGGGTSGPDFDWAFNLIAEDRLTTFATIAWAPGSTNGTRNDNPIWVTPAKNTTVYVKYNGDVTTGGSVSPCGFRYDVSYTVNALKYKRILDSDNDQSGIAIYTCDGTKIAAVYGEDPSTAADANPSWDVGTTIKPYCATKLIFANDDYAYSLTDRAVTVQVLSNDVGFTAVIDPSTVTVSGVLQPKHGTVTVNDNGTLLYTPNPGYIGLDSLEYTVCSTPTPVCDIALVIIKINGCPTPANQNILSGQVFLDKNKDGIRNDDGTGFAPAKVYLYADGDCDGVIDVNELKDSVVVDNSGTYQFITYPERTIADNFDGPAGTSTCATGSDGNTSWKSNWVDAGDAGGATGLCASASGDAEVVKDGSFGYALRLMDNNVSATRTVNISGASAAFLSFSYRVASGSLSAGKDIIVQASTNGTSFSTIYTISGDGTSDANYVRVLNQDLLPYAGTATTTYIRFLTNNNVGSSDIVYIDDISITYLKFPICYITAIDAATVPDDYYISTASQNNMTALNGGTCLFPFDFGMAKKIITISGTLYNDVNGLTDNLVNGTAMGAPSGNTMYAYLVDAAGKVEFKTNVNSLTGTYSFPDAEVGTDYTVVISTSDVAVGATRPATANLPAGWISTGDAYGTINRAGTGNEAGVPDVSIAVKVGLFSVTGVNFGIEQRPSAGGGSNVAINPGGITAVTVPANTFNNLLANSDVAPGSISGIRITTFPTGILTIVINGASYTASTFPAAGVTIPANSSGQPTQVITVDPLNGPVKVTIPFYVIDNAGATSLTIGTAVLQLLIDTDKDGIADINDIDDDNDGITDVIEICGNGATGFACAPGGKDPALDNDNDGISNWQDADYGPLNANGCTASLDKDGDGIPDFLDLDSDNDGVPDVVEAYGVDTDGNGVIDNFTDTDGDGLSQNVDANNTGAAGSGNGLGFIDLDGDGIPNSFDLDSDNDGIPDILEVGGTDVNNDGRIDGFVDTDSDGLANSVDGDADNNGTIENLTGPLLKTGPSLNNDGRASNYPAKNADFIGKPNLYDLDSDGDGITDVIEAGFPGSIGITNGQVSGGKTNGWANSIQALSQLNLRNSDGRGPANYLDIDSDDDGITDNIEAQSTNGYKLPSDTDSDGDGLADVYEISSGTFGANGLTPFDNDGDGTPDYIDTDTDNDGAPDLNEASRLFSLTQANINSADIDGDGLLDEFDLLNITQLAAGGIFRNMTNSNFGALGTLNGPLPSGSNVKIVKSSASLNDRDWRNIVVLPLQIVSFTGTYQNNTVSLEWQVKNESEVSHYEIERSSNGIDFGKIATVKALNRDNSNYAYADDISMVSLSNVYYRIRQVEKTGLSLLTNVVRWKIANANEQPLLYPNPVQTDLKIRYVSKENQTADVIVLDAKGQSVLSTKFTVVRGQNILTLPRMGSLNKGSYMLRFHSGSNTWMLRFIVQ